MLLSGSCGTSEEFADLKNSASWFNYICALLCFADLKGDLHSIKCAGGCGVLQQNQIVLLLWEMDNNVFRINNSSGELRAKAAEG